MIHPFVIYNPIYDKLDRCYGTPTAQIRKPRDESVKYLLKVTQLVYDGVRIQTPESILYVTILHCLLLGDIHEIIRTDIKGWTLCTEKNTHHGCLQQQLFWKL